MGFRQPGAHEVTRLIEAFRAQPASSVLAKLDILLQLARLDDPRIGPFLLAVFWIGMSQARSVSMRSRG
jgi:hypothetical protein